MGLSIVSGKSRNTFGACCSVMCPVTSFDPEASEELSQRRESSSLININKKEKNERCVDRTLLFNLFCYLFPVLPFSPFPTPRTTPATSQKQLPFQRVEGMHNVTYFACPATDETTSLARDQEVGGFYGTFGGARSKQQVPARLWSVTCSLKQRNFYWSRCPLSGQRLKLIISFQSAFKEGDIMSSRKLENKDSSVISQYDLQYPFPFTVNLDLEKLRTVERSRTVTLSFTELHSLSLMVFC